MLLRLAEAPFRKKKANEPRLDGKHPRGSLVGLRFFR